MKLSKEMTDMLKKKLTSRKFWTALAGFAVAVGTAFGCPRISEESVTLIVSGCVALSAYIIGEGIADSANKKQ